MQVGVIRLRLASSMGSAFQFPEGYPSGQRGQTVNLLAYAFGGSNPPPSTRFLYPAMLFDRRLGNPSRSLPARE